MKKMLSNFMYNLKMYLKYIVKVGFKELFFDVIILVLMAVIAAFVFVPIDLLKDLVGLFIQSFTSLTGVMASIHIWIFQLIQAVCAILAFIYLFNIRYDFKNNKVVPIEGTHTLERKDDINLTKDNVKVNKSKENELDLPKEKEDL